MASPVYISGESYPVLPYRPLPYQCQKWRFGHPAIHRRSTACFAQCGQPGNDRSNCLVQSRTCVNSGDSHAFIGAAQIRFRV